MKNILTDKAVKSAKPKADGKNSRLSDGDGLFLLIKPQGKYWHFDFRFEGKRQTLAYGVYPTVKLKQAREMHEAARGLLARGINPREYKKTQRKLQTQLAKNSFEAMAREYHQKFRNTWQPSAMQISNSQLEKYER